MTISRRKVDGGIERKIIIAMVTSKRFLTYASNVMDLDLVEVPHFKTVAEWCLAFFKEHGKAPKSHIEDFYHKWSEDNDNREQVDAVHAFLESLSVEHDRAKEINVPFMCGELNEFLTKRKTAKLTESLTYNMLHGNVKEAQENILAFRMTAPERDDGFDVRDPGRMSLAFASPREPIIEFQGDAGKFFNYAMTRGSLIAIQAPEKTGKTFWCIEFAMRAIRNRRKVAFFEVGDLTESELQLRLAVRYSARPLWQRQVGRIPIPTSIEVDDNEDCGYKVSSEVKTVKNIVTEDSYKRAQERFARGCGHSPGVPYMMVCVRPNSSINVRGISNILDKWKVERDFIADCVVIDYGDILAPEDTGRKHEQDRNVVNDTWKALRRLSQERHALVIVPTQAKADSYNVTNEPILQTMKSFSDDKRKLAHVTGMIGLNQTPEEKEMQGMRLNWIVLRGAPYNITKPLYVGTCFPLARALCCASF